MAKEDKLFISIYNDYYGGLLTGRQCEMLKLYYDCDMSLAEIAEESGISRQAVRDCLMRAEAQLVECEQKVGIVARISKIKNLLADVEGWIERDGEIARQKLRELREELE